MNNLKVTLKQLAVIIPQLFKANTLVPFIQSSPGIGKSSLAAQIADKFGLKLIDVRLAECDPTDIGGLPYFDEKTGKTKTYPYETFPTTDTPIPEGYKGWLLMLDEFNSAPLSVQGASYKVVLDRKVGQHTLHNRVFIIAAGNLETDNAIVNPLSSAMVSRFAMFEVQLSHQDWMEWATDNGIDYRITGFLNWKPDFLYTFNPDACDKPYSCPRTWEALSKVLVKMKDTTNLLYIAASMVGEGVAREFIAYIELYHKLPTFQTLISKPDAFVLDDNMSIRWATMGMLAHNIKPDNVIACCTILDKFPHELIVVALREITTRHKSLRHESKEFSKWLSATSVKILA